MNLGVLEAQPLDGVVQLDVDAEVVAVQLQLVVVAQPGVGRDPHRQRGDGRLDRQLPVAVGGRFGVERDHGAPLGSWMSSFYIGYSDSSSRCRSS